MEELLDEELPPQQIGPQDADEALAAIEDLALEALLDLADGRLPLTDRLAQQVSFTAPACPQACCQTGSSELLCAQATGSRSFQHPLVASQGQGAAAFTRVVAILDRAHQQLRAGCSVALRDLCGSQDLLRCLQHALLTAGRVQVLPAQAADA